LSGSFYVLEPDSSSSGDFEIWASTAWALNVSVSDFRDEVNGFFRGAVEFLFLEPPGFPAISALQRCSRSCDVKLGVLKFGWLKLLKRELEDFAFDLLEFADFHVDFRDFAEFFFLGDFGCSLDYGFGKCPFMHGKANGDEPVKHFEKRSAVVLGD
jgi:hypothetical protein